MFSPLTYFFLTVEIIAVFCIMMGNFPAKTLHLYPLYMVRAAGDDLFSVFFCNSCMVNSSDFKIELPDSFSGTFGMWTGRTYYTGEGSYDRNEFDDRINAVRVFQIFSILLVIVGFMLQVNEMCQNKFEDDGEQEPSAAYEFYRAQYIIAIFQYFCVLICAWIYTSLIQLDWISWPLGLLIIGVCMSILAVAVLTARIASPPRQGKGNNRITGTPLVLLLVAIGIAVLTLLMSFGCLASFEPPRPFYGDLEISQTTLSILANSYPNTSYKNAAYAFFSLQLVINILVVVLTSVMILMTNEDVIRRFTYAVLIAVMVLYSFSLGTTWIISRAPALFDPLIYKTRYSSALVIEAVKFAFNNCLMALVIAAFVVNPKDPDQNRLHRPNEYEDDPYADDEGGPPFEVGEGDYLVNKNFNPGEPEQEP